MMGVKQTLIAVLTSTLLLVNTVCACALPADPERSESESSAHAHHQVESDQSIVKSDLCAHEDCDNCENIEVTAKVERDATLIKLPKSDSDQEDFAWAVASIDTGALTVASARAGPMLHGPSWAFSTPVSRADRLIE